MWILKVAVVYRLGVVEEARRTAVPDSKPGTLRAVPAVPIASVFKITDGAAVLELVSVNVNRAVGYAAAAAGFDFGATVNETESVVRVTPKKLTVTVAPVVESDFAPAVEPVSPFPPPTDAVPAVALAVSVRLVAGIIACEGAELRTPIPKAATATSAMRLKFVVVDIYFLSLVATRNFLVTASR
jgi:hypothetical protein